MTRKETVRRLTRNRGKLAAFHVRRLSLFGSTARDEAHEHSDVDLLVEFEPDARVGLFTFVALQRFLGDVLGTRIDLATPDALRPDMRAQILDDAVRVL